MVSSEGSDQEKKRARTAEVDREYHSYVGYGIDLWPGRHRNKQVEAIITFGKFQPILLKLEKSVCRRDTHFVERGLR